MTRIKPPRLIAGSRAFSHRPFVLNAKSSHHDAESFLQYASTVGLSRNTSVYTGTLYEYTVLQALSRCHMTLTRSGGRDDKGIDLTGSWTIPSDSTAPSFTHPVLIQCKAEQAKPGPRHLRELEGVLWSPSTPKDTIGILASMSHCTLGMRKHMLVSPRPLAYCWVAPYDEGGYLRQFLWNGATASLLGRRLGVTTRYTPSGDGETIKTEAVITLDGHIVDVDDCKDNVLPSTRTGQQSIGGNLPSQKS